MSNILGSNRISKASILELVNAGNIEVIEQHLVYSFIQHNNLSINNSPVISNLLCEFKLNEDIFQKVECLKIYDLKQLENYLELLIPKNDRKINGAFFTPTYIVEFIINKVSPKSNDKCLDPSCGCGAFLIGLVEYFSCKYGHSIKKIIQNNIFGSDILEYNVKRTKIILSLFGLLNNETIEEQDFNIYHRDSLKTKWDEKFDIVVGNPPYVKYQDLTDENRSYLINNWKTIENGTFNLYFAFFELGYKLLSENGKLGYITPNNYFTSLAGMSLRRFFMEKKCVTRIVDFRHRKIFDAQTYTAITFLDRKENSEILYDYLIEEQTIPNFLKSVNGSINKLKNLNIKKWRLLKSEEQENIRIIENIGTPIRDLFNIAVGIATLKDEVFFVNSIADDDGFLSKTTENGTFQIERDATKPVYKISKIKNQEDIQNNTLRIITPYHTNQKNALPILEDEFKEKFPKCYEYLLSEKVKLKSRDKGKSKLSPFYLWGRTQGITRFGKKLLNPTFSKKPRFLFTPEEDAYYTNGYGIYLNKTKKENSSLFDNIHPLSNEENILLVQKILNSIVMEYYINKTSVSIQGGFPCYQKNFIEKFTIPNLSEEELETLNNLTDKGEIDEFLIKKYQLNIPFPNRAS